MTKTQTHRLKYGRTVQTVQLPASAQRFTFTEPVCDIHRAAFGAGLEDCLRGENLSGQVAVVVADKTRLCGYTQILPWVVETLQKLGAAKEHIVFYIAYGTHPEQSEQECVYAYGELYHEHTFVHHHCTEGEFVHLGDTVRGTPAWLRKDLMAASLILTVGAVSHHYFAGYGGGRKLLFPGLAERSALYANHSLFLDRNRGELAAGCQPGKLEGNPLAEDLLEIHGMLPAYCSIHTILGSDGKPAQYWFGRSYQDFLDVCTRLDSCYKVATDRQYDLVVASAGGYPKDINLIQVHKSIHHAAPLVRDGGTLILFAECADGVGSETFLPYFAMGGWQQTFAHLAKQYAGNGGTALAMMQKTARISVCLVTELAEELCWLIGVEKMSAADVRQRLAGHDEGSVALVENSSILVAQHVAGR